MVNVDLDDAFAQSDASTRSAQRSNCLAAENIDFVQTEKPQIRTERHFAPTPTTEALKRKRKAELKR